MKLRKLLCLIIVALLSAACTETTPQVEVLARSPTHAAHPTHTPYPTPSPVTVAPTTDTLTAEPTATPTATNTRAHTPTAATAITYAEVASHGLNLRSGPSADHDIVQELHRGDRLEVLDGTPDGIWIAVVAPSGAEGWVHSEYVTTTEAVVSDLPHPDPSSTPKPSPLPRLTAMSGLVPEYSVVEVENFPVGRATIDLRIYIGTDNVVQ